MKKQLFLMVTLLAVAPIYARKEESKPEFDKGYIKMATQGGLCGGVTFIPDPNTRVQVQAQRFSEGLFSSTTKPGKPLNDWIELPAGGLRVRYDWGGTLPSSHYRVYCRRMNDRGRWMPVNCQEVVKLDAIKHNYGCVVGPLGPSADYKPLNMTTGAKPISIQAGG